MAMMTAPSIPMKTTDWGLEDMNTKGLQCQDNVIKKKYEVDGQL